MARATQSYIGIDIGSANIKVVELRDVNRVPELATYGMAERPLDVPLPGDEEGIREIADTVMAVCKQAGTKSKKVITALPTNAVFTSLISLPKMPKNELLAAVQWEAKKVIPRPIEEMILDSQTLDLPAADGGQRVLLTAAPKTLVQHYVNIFKKSGLTLISLETEAFSLIRSLIGRDPAPTALVDLGSSHTDIVIVEQAVPYLHRSLAVAGLAVTKAMSKAAGSSLSEAEQMKYDLGVAAIGAPAMATPKVVNDAIEPIINEVRYTLGLYTEQSGRKIEKVILAGGSAQLATLSTTLANTLKLRVFIGDPWARVRYPLELKGVLQESAPNFGVAVGLAMRDIK